MGICQCKDTNLINQITKKEVDIPNIQFELENDSRIKLNGNKINTYTKMSRKNTKNDKLNYVNPIGSVSSTEIFSRNNTKQTELMWKKKTFNNSFSSRNICSRFQKENKKDFNLFKENINDIQKYLKEQSIQLIEQTNENNEINENSDDNTINKINNISQKEKDFIFECLSNHFYFRNYNKLILKKILNEFKIIIYEINQTIIKQNDIADNFYIIKSGKVELNNTIILDTKNTFGEISLLSTQNKYAYNCQTINKTELFYISRISFLKLVSEDNNIKNKLNDEYFNSFINSSILFSTMNKTELDAIKELTYFYEYKNAQTKLYINTNTNNKLIYVYKGELQIINNQSISNKKYIFKEGKIINLLSIFTDQNNTNKINIIVKKPNTITIFLYAQVLIEVLGTSYKQKIFLNCLKNKINSDIFFINLKKFNQIDDELLISSFAFKYYNSNDKIIEKNKNINNTLYFIISGIFIQNNIQIAQTNEFFNQEYFIKNRPLDFDIYAGMDTYVLESTMNSLKNVLINNKKNINYLNKLYSLSNYYQIFKDLSSNELIILANESENIKYKKNDIIIQKNKKIEELFLINRGQIKVTKELKDKKLKVIDSYNTFGEIFFLDENDCPYFYITKTEEAEIIKIKGNKFLELLTNEYVNNYVKKQIYYENLNIRLSDLFYISYLGRGKFGNVCLVHDEMNFYAIKGISKKSVNIQKLGPNHLMNEKKNLINLNHPFILRCIKTLKNNKWFFFLTEFIKGINMNEYLEKRNNKCTLYEVKFYSSSLFLAINYVHSKRIIHRDIKPANIMIDQNGYLKLIDFGVSKKLKNTLKTFTVIGTPNFLAPEVLLGKGYGFSCDYWSIGIFIYNIYYGKVPFGGENKTIKETYDEILKNNIEFPESNPDLNYFISLLLEKNPNNRLTNLLNIQQNSFFNFFTWDYLYLQLLNPPFIPSKDLRCKDDFLTILNNPFDLFINKEKDNVQFTNYDYNSFNIGNTSKDNPSNTHFDNWENEF